MFTMNINLPAMAPYQYPENYDQLGDKFKADILRWFKNKDIARANYASTGSTSMALDIQNQMRNKMWELAESRIYIGFDNVGHRGEWFLITSHDAYCAAELCS